jgi:hypothetical protein
MSNLNKLSKMKNSVVAFSMVLSLLIGCTQKTPAPGEVKLSWEMVSNEYAETPKAKAKFYIENSSHFPTATGHSISVRCRALRFLPTTM